VFVGFDLSAEEWAREIRRALAEFGEHPHVLQRFVKGAVTVQEFADVGGEMQTLPGRTRICPYYFVANDRVSLGGVLASHVPSDKKLIHGMSDAIISPASAAN
jgi:hypothetical protein